MQILLFFNDSCILECRYQCFHEDPFVFAMILAFLIADPIVFGMILTFVHADAIVVEMFPAAVCNDSRFLSADTVVFI